MSIEASARTITIISITRLQALKQAKHFYESVRDLLNSPRMMTYAGRTMEAERYRNLSPSSFSSSCISSSNAQDSTTPDQASSTASPLDWGECANQRLDINLSSSCDSTTTTSIEMGSKAEELFSEKLSQWTSEEEDDDNNSGSSTPKAKGVIDETDAWLRDRSIGRYRACLDDFALALATHLRSVDDLISATNEAQAVRYTTRNLAGYADDEEARAADLRERIQRLRTRGWARNRFDATRYEQLCEAALAEL